MKRFILTIAAVAFTGILFAGADVQAAGPKGSPKSPSKVSHSSKTKFSQHHNFHHRTYRGWTRYCWFPDYGCYGFYDPSCGCWYYWYEPAGQFQPIDTMAANAPTTSGAAQLPPGAVNVPTPSTSNGPPNSTTPPPLPPPAVGNP